MARHFTSESSQYLGIALPVATSAPVTMVAWFNCDSIAANQVILCISDYSGGQYGEWFMLNVNSAGAKPVQAQVFDQNTVRTASTSTGLTVGQWHHAAGVFAADNDRAVFIDGGSKGTNTVAASPDGVSHTAIGINWRDGLPYPDPFDGSIAEAAIWNVALLEAEVALLAKGLCPLFIRPQNIAGYWSLLRSDRDYFGVYNMTPVNSPTWADHKAIFYPSVPMVVVPPVAVPSGNPWYAYAQM